VFCSADLIEPTTVTDNASSDRIVVAHLTLAGIALRAKRKTTNKYIELLEEMAFFD